MIRVLLAAGVLFVGGCAPRVDQVYLEHRETLQGVQERLARVAKELPDPPRTAGPAPTLDPRPEMSRAVYNVTWIPAGTAADPSQWEHQGAMPALYLSSGMELEHVLRAVLNQGADFEGMRDAHEAARIQVAATLRYALLYRYLERGSTASDDYRGVMGTWLVDLRTGEVRDSLRVPIGSGYSESQGQLSKAWEARHQTTLKAGGPQIFLQIAEDARDLERVLMWVAILSMMVVPLMILKGANIYMVQQVRAFARQFGLEVSENRWWGLAHHPGAQGPVDGRRVAYRSTVLGGGKQAVTLGILEVAAALPAETAFHLKRVSRLFEGGRIREALAAPTIGDAAFGEFFEGAEPVLPLLEDADRRALIQFADGELVTTETGLLFRITQTVMSSQANRALFTAVLEVLLRLAPRLEAGS